MISFVKKGVVVLNVNMYEDATKEELIDKIHQLERHVVQLKNVIAKSQVFNTTVIVSNCGVERIPYRRRY